MATTCAACGSEGGDSLKACTACKLVKYCNRDCQITHRPTHKKICKRAEKGKLTAEDYDNLRQLAREAALKRTEDPLKNWVRPAPVECPICMVPLAIELFSGSPASTADPALPVAKLYVVDVSSIIWRR